MGRGVRDSPLEAGHRGGGGWRIIRTMGHRPTRLRPVHGFAADTAAGTVSEGASRLGFPLSTTHTIASATCRLIAPRAKARIGDTVTLVVAGKGTAPNVVGMKPLDATNELIATGFHKPKSSLFDPSAKGEPQTVVPQEPPANSLFDFDQRVTLWVVRPAEGSEG